MLQCETQYIHCDSVIQIPLIEPEKLKLSGFCVFVFSYIIEIVCMSSWLTAVLTKWYL